VNQRQIKELFESVIAVGQNYDIDIKTSLNESDPRWINIEILDHCGGNRGETFTWRIAHVGKFKNVDMLQLEFLDETNVIARHTVPADPLVIFATMYVD
jgi:hypothetical protein